MLIIVLLYLEAAIQETFSLLSIMGCLWLRDCFEFRTSLWETGFLMYK